MYDNIITKIFTNQEKPFEERGVTMPIPNPSPAFQTPTEYTNIGSTEKK